LEPATLVVRADRRVAHFRCRHKRPTVTTAPLQLPISPKSACLDEARPLTLSLVGFAARFYPHGPLAHETAKFNSRSNRLEAAGLIAIRLANNFDIESL